jgi:hypothetical protein
MPRNNIHYDRQFSKSCSLVHAETLDLLAHVAVNKRLPIYVHLHTYDHKINTGSGYKSKRIIQRNILRDYSGHPAVFFPDGRRIIINTNDQNEFWRNAYRKSSHSITDTIMIGDLKKEKIIPETFGELFSVINYAWTTLQDEYFNVRGRYFNPDSNNKKNHIECDTPVELGVYMDMFYAELATQLSNIDFLNLSGIVQNLVHIVDEITNPNFEAVFHEQTQKNFSFVIDWLSFIYRTSTFIPSLTAHKLVQEIRSIEAIVKYEHLTQSPEGLWHEVLAPMSLE